MEVQKVNWRRGAFRVWLVASAIWLAFAGYQLFLAYPARPDDYPNSYRAYLPECPLEEGLAGNGLARGLPDNWSGSVEPPPLRVCTPPLGEILGYDTEGVAAARERYEQCVAARDREAAEYERQREEERRACLARREHPDTIAAAKSSLRGAQLEWVGGILLRLLVLLAAPIVVWFLVLWTFRLGRWIIRGFHT